MPLLRRLKHATRVRHATASVRAGFRDGGPGPQASHQQGASHQTPQFLLANDRCLLVILIEDFEINEN